MKKCPYCAEEIQDVAIKCRYCGEMLSKPNITPILKNVCPKCLKEYDNTWKMCLDCGIPLGNPTGEVKIEDSGAKPSNGLKKSDKEYKVVNPFPAKQGRRFVNFLLDHVFLYIFALGFYLLAFLMGELGRQFVTNTSKWVLGISMGFIFYLLFESIWNKTPAKFITKTKVVAEDGSKPDFKRILIRTLCRFIPLEALSFLGSDRPVGWHDKFSKTMVIDDRVMDESDIPKKYLKKDKILEVVIEDGHWICPFCKESNLEINDLCRNCNQEVIKK